RKLVPVLVVVMALVAAATAAFAVTRVAGPRVRVPNLVGAGYEAARDTAGKAGLEVRRQRRPADDPAGTVIAQDPEPGTFSTRGRALVLTLSAGPPPVEVPAVTGRGLDDARSALESAGFEVVETSDFHETVPAGSVATQNPAEGAEAPPGSQVQLVISSGPKPVKVPNVIGKAYAEAVELLAASGFEAKRVEDYSDTVAPGDVIRQDPVGDEEVARDSTVTVVVSKGPDVVEVPDVRGEDLEDAVQQLEDEGLEVDVVGFRFDRPVRRQDPSPGEEVRRGETVTLYL
ncbi:MAG: PASTA domain-containing protein, partial [Acidimicrobiia bacterium]